MSKRAVIIGSGLGGLECGLILARSGYDVTVLEKHPVSIGGCLQSFCRRVAQAETADGKAEPCPQNLTFDTGFHYVGALDEGQSLHRIFAYFGLLDLPWKRMDADCVDEIVVDGHSYPLASGYDNFVERLAEHFPKERDGLRKYVAFLKDVGDNIFRPLGPHFLEDGQLNYAEAPQGGPNPLFGRSAKAFVEETISDPTLRRVLEGAFMRCPVNEATPLYTFAQINDSFIRSAWRLEGGGQQIAERLAEQIRSLGGKVLTGAQVSGIEQTDGAVSGVLVRHHNAVTVPFGGPLIAKTAQNAVTVPNFGTPTAPATSTAPGVEFLPADIVVSDIHPAATVALIGRDAPVRKVYRDRISALENGRGVFTANIALKPGTLPYLNKNIFIQHGQDRLMIHFYLPEKDIDGYATHVDLIMPVDSGPDPASPKAYAEWKYALLHQSFELAETRVSGLRDAISAVWTSTPHTWEQFTGSPGGSAFGIQKDWRNPIGTLLSPRTPLKGLFLTGQNLNLHGLLGVSITSFLSCREILGSASASLGKE